MMNLFRRAKPDAQGYYEAAAADSVHPNAMVKIKIEGRQVVLTRFEGQPYAFSAICPHAAADLSQGTLNRWKVSCPDHGYCFDVRSGRILWPEDEPYGLRLYPAKEENGMILVKLT